MLKIFQEKNTYKKLRPQIDREFHDFVLGEITCCSIVLDSGCNLWKK